MPQIVADDVLAAARAQHQDWIDRATAERIAAGAAAAVAAVEAGLRDPGPGQAAEAMGFLDVLEELADSPA